MAALFGDDGEKPGKQKKMVVSFSERQLFSVSCAKVLLSTEQHKDLLAEIRERVAAPDKYYDALYMKLINDFAEFVQVLPTTNRSVLGGILHEGLRRALYVLDEYKPGKPRMHPLWTYVLFSAALLFDVSRVVEDRTIIISNKHGAFVSKWEPIDGTLLDQHADYYKIRRGGGVPAWLGRRMTPLLAYKLMPEIGFKWINSKPQALTIWLSLLSDDARSAGGYGLRFNKAEELLNRFIVSKNFFITVPVDITEPLETQLGEKFAEWLKQGLDDGTILFNEADAHVFMVEDGLFLETPDIFKDFAKADHSSPDWRVVRQQFSELGFASIRDGDYGSHQYFSEYSKAGVERAATGSAKDAAKAGFMKGAQTQQSVSKGVDVAKSGVMFGATKTVTAASITQQHAETRGTSNISTHIKNGAVVPAAMVAALLGSQAAYQVDTNLRAANVHPQDPYPNINVSVHYSAQSSYSSN